MKEKIAIITRRAGFNMGSSLQAFAMSKFINDLGYPNIIIKYDEYSKFISWRIKPFINSLIFNMLSHSPKIIKHIFSRKYKQLCIANKQIKKFADFEEKYIHLTSNEYRSIKSLARDFNSYDACICGSDQIWNPDYYDPAFMLSFINSSSKTKKIAYAPSIGIINKKMIAKEAKALINMFDSISCREAEGCLILKEITGHQVIQVLDPTLMISIETYKKMRSSSYLSHNKDYILTYFLQRKNNINNIPNQYIKELSRQTNLPVYNINLFNLMNNVHADKNINAIGPSEFLSLISNASWICTNSFHCCIFSFLFQKKFSVFERFQIKGTQIDSGQNSRIYSLLELLAMKECLKKISDKPNINQQFNYEQGINNLAVQQTISKQYIIDILSKK